MKQVKTLNQLSGFAIILSSTAGDLRFDLKHRVGTILGSDPDELLAIGVATLYFIKTALKIAGPRDHRSTSENLVYERAGLGAVEQAGAGFSF